MEEFLSKKICDFCCEGTSKEEKEVVLYGIQLLVEGTFKMLILLLFASIIGKFCECLQFYLVFCPLRTMAGGIHCKTNVGCTLSFLGIFVSGLLCDMVLIPEWLMGSSFLLCLIVCLKWAPSSTENNPITNVEVRIRKKVISILLLVFWFLEIKYSIFHFNQGYIFATATSLSLLIIFQEVSLWKRRTLRK